MQLIRFSRPLLYIFLIMMALLFLMPIYVMVITSIKPLSEVTLSQMWQLPSSISFEAYKTALDRIAPSLVNSFYLVIPAAVFSALLGSLNGYVLSKWKFRGSDGIFTAILFGMFIPYQSILIPLIKFLQGIGLYNSIAGLVLVHVVYGIPITTLIFRNFYASVPNELIEAAKEKSGTNEFQLLNETYDVQPIKP